jgi:FSR family fosmidomycin resistance protein-like MFS transporter
VFFLILSTFTAAILNSIIPFIPLLIVDHFGMSKETAAGCLSLIFLAVFWASPLGGYLADRLGSVKVVIAACFIVGPTVFLLTVLPFGWMIWGLLLLVGTVIYSRMSASESFIMWQARVGTRSTILGVYYFSSMEGGGILTPIVGYLIDHFGFIAAFGAAGGALLAITLLCSFWLRDGSNGDELETDMQRKGEFDDQARGSGQIQTGGDDGTDRRTEEVHGRPSRPDSGN